MGEACWATAREERIRQDAASVRALYLAGYIAGGLGVAVAGTELFLLPSPTSGGGSLLLSGRF